MITFGGLVWWLKLTMKRKILKSNLSIHMALLETSDGHKERINAGYQKLRSYNHRHANISATGRTYSNDYNVIIQNFITLY